jgi:hypothetical protein
MTRREKWIKSSLEIGFEVVATDIGGGSGG